MAEEDRYAGWDGNHGKCFTTAENSAKIAVVSGKGGKLVSMPMLEGWERKCDGFIEAGDCHWIKRLCSWVVVGEDSPLIGTPVGHVICAICEVRGDA